MNDPKHYLLDKVISRIDAYISTINQKTIFIISFNVFVIGATTARYNDIINIFKNPKIATLVSIILLIISLGSLLSILFTLLAIHPYLKTGNTPPSYHSLLFLVPYLK